MRTIFLILIGLSSLSFAEFSKQNGVVTDSTTQLEWQDDYSDNSGDIKKTTWQSAIDYCEALSLDGGGWRLPNVRELESLVYNPDQHPNINSIFELISFSYYWSATTNANRSGNTWIIDFGYGIVAENYNKSNIYAVRCVRVVE